MLAVMTNTFAMRVDDEAEAYRLADQIVSKTKESIEIQLMGLNAERGTDWTMEDAEKFFQQLGCHISIVPEEVYD